MKQETTGFRTRLNAFAGYLPERAMNALESLNVTTLEGMLWWMTAIAAAKLTGCVVDYAGQSPRFRTKSLGSLPCGNSPHERSEDLRSEGDASNERENGAMK